MNFIKNIDNEFYKKYYNEFYKNIIFNLKLNYYRYLNPYVINHYNIINKLLTYKSIGVSYYSKYPKAQSFMNLNEELFSSNPKAKEEYIKSSEIQEKIKKSLINDINIICKSNKNYKISSENFQSYYIKYNYHIEQNIDSMIDYIKNDIIKNDIIKNDYDKFLV